MIINFKPEDMKVLLVDDTMENIKVLISTLEPTGYQLVFANSGANALELVTKFKPDLILLDIVMPEMDGFETCKQLKSNKKTKNIPVIFTTAKTNQEDIVQGFKVGGVDYITKPYHNDELRARIQTQLMLRSAMSKLESNNRQLSEYQDHLEELVKHRTSSLEVSNAALEAYSYSLAHDLRTPLRGIISLSQLLANDATEKLTTDEADVLNRIIKAGLHMSRLIEGTQKLFAVTTSEMVFKTVDLTRIIRAIIAKLENNNPSRSVNFIIEAEVKVYGDANALRTVMKHLIRNAWNFTSQKKHSNIEIGWYQENEEDICFVRDNGIGFDPQYAHKLFDSFALTHTSEEDNLGFGLVMVQRIIQRLGGKAWAEGKPDEGATFYFSLPCKKSKKRNLI